MSTVGGVVTGETSGRVEAGPVGAGGVIASGGVAGFSGDSGTSDAGALRKSCSASRIPLWVNTTRFTASSFSLRGRGQASSARNPAGSTGPVSVSRCRRFF